MADGSDVTTDLARRIVRLNPELAERAALEAEVERLREDRDRWRDCARTLYAKWQAGDKPPSPSALGRLGFQMQEPQKPASDSSSGSDRSCATRQPTRCPATLVAGVLPVRDPFEPPRDMLAAHRDADGARMSSAKSDRDDFLACRRGEISSEEYVRRLEERVRQMNENAPMGGRYYPLYPREDPKRAARRGFWDGVASVFRLGRR